MATVDKLGPGLLTIGDEGTKKEFSTHTSKTQIKPELSEEEPVHLLDGGAYHDTGEWAGSLSGEILQEYSMESILAWTWEHSGEVLPFTFIPKTGTIVVKGKCRITPVQIGGDVKKANTSEFDFKLTEKPTIVAAAGGGGN